ncbi:MAG: carboxymuconolactone decarboxylase family protein [Motiliproteus sp.]|nr:carboxymuconolactone decarboxylase family protein [Motiliproteus sp.]MCW9054122.1 carboxymuconolactone decarboxylase family protein [Motiliproteus sp.]
MTDFPLHDLDTAPEQSKPLLQNSIKGFGMIPSLHAVMSSSPQLLEGYQLLHKLFQETSFNKEELTVVWQTINVEHECHYCVPAHSLIANMMGVDSELNQALRDRSPLSDPKLQVLHETTLAMVRGRGQISPEQTQAFYNAGYGHQQMLEIVLGLAQKVMSNYVNHIADTPIDERFKQFI